MIETKTTGQIIGSVHIEDTIYLDKAEFDKQKDVRWVKVEDINEWLIEEGNIPQSDGKILIKLHEELKK